MRTRGMIVMPLAKGEKQQVLVEAGSEVVVLAGSAILREPPLWLAESVLYRELEMHAEQRVCLDESGWIELVALSTCELMVLAPQRRSLWAGIAGVLRHFQPDISKLRYSGAGLPGQ